MNPPTQISQDLELVSYMRKTKVLELRQRRQNYALYQEQQKHKMIDFLTTCFLVEPLVVKLGKLVPIEFSIFQGIREHKPGEAGNNGSMGFAPEVEKIIPKFLEIAAIERLFPRPPFDEKEEASNADEEEELEYDVEDDEDEATKKGNVAIPPPTAN